MPEDGSLPGGGVIPHVIEWDGGVRPWDTIAETGCYLEELILTHPDPYWLKDALTSLGASCLNRVSVREGVLPALAAQIATPSGAIVTI